MYPTKSGTCSKKWEVMGNLKILSIFMSALIITLPLNTAYVMGMINSVKVQDKNGQDSYVAESEDYFKILAMLDSETSNSKIRTNYPSNLPFDECHADGGQYACTFTSKVQDMNSGRYSFTVTEYDDAGQQMDKAESEFYVDGEKPVIPEFNANQTGENLQFSYMARDSACQGCTNKCSGINSLVLMQDSTVLKTITPKSGSCEASGSGEIAISSLGESTGSAGICLMAIDNVGLESEKKCVKAEIDTDKPEFEGDLFRITDKDGQNITYVASYPIGALIEIAVFDPHLDQGSVTADLSALNSISGDKYKDIKGACMRDGDDYICSWDAVVDKASANPNLYFSALDSFGNAAEFKKSLSIKSDTVKPEIEGITSNSMPGGKTIALTSGNNSIKIRLDSSGSGYLKKNVYIDLSGAGGPSRLRADTCYKEEGGWYCYFTPTLTNSQGYEGYFTVKAEDDAGNSMVSEQFMVVFDNNKPVIKDISLSSGCAVAGEGLTVDVVVDDESAISMTVDASRISTLNDPVTADCVEDTSGTYTCSASIYDLFTSYTKDSIGIMVKDAAGNAVHRDYSVEICEAVSGVTPNLVSAHVGDITPVDKRLLSYLPTTVYIPVTFSTSAQIIRDTVSCTGSSRNHFLNEGSKDSTLVSRLDKQSVGENASSIVLDCTIDLVMKKGTKVYSTPETERLNITIPLYNNPFGEVSESMKGKIAGVDSDIKGLQDDIDRWEQWNMWLNMLCSMAESIGKLNSLLQTIKSILWSLNCSLSNFPPTRVEAVANWMTECGTLSKFNGFVENFVWPTGFDLSITVGNGVKYGCMLYSCRLCDWSTYLNVGVSAAGAALMPKTVTKTALGDQAPGIEEYRLSQIGGPVDWNSIKLIDNSIDQVPIYFSWTKTQAKSFGDRWSEAAKKTELTSPSDSSKWVYDPYKSIHYASTCLCLPGYIYNLKKDRQIKCLYKTCLEESSKSGLPTGTCDNSYAERECLYVDSAQFKEHGYLPAFDNIINALVQMLPGIIVGIGYAASCPDYKHDFIGVTCGELPATVCENIRAATCGLSAAATAILEMSDIMDGGLGFSKYNTDLGGTDYCSGGAP